MREQITQNQFWTGLILAFFILAFGQNALAQKKRKNTSNQQKSPSSKVKLNEYGNTAEVDETTEWLRSRIGDLAWGTYDISTPGPGAFFVTEKNYTSGWATNSQISVINIVGGGHSCDVQINKERALSENSFDKISLRFALGDLDPQSAKVNKFDGNKFAVVLETTSGQKQFSLGHSFGIPKDKQPNSFGAKDIFFVLYDEDSANRMMRAFRHAIQLCGGKVAPF